MVGTKTKSLSQAIADGLSRLNVGDTVIVAWCLGHPHQETHTARVEKITGKQIVVEGRYFWKGSGKETGSGTYEIYPNDESLIEWAVFMDLAESAKHKINQMSQEHLKELLQVFEKHGYLS